MNNAAKNFDILETNLSVLHKYFNSFKINFLICNQLRFLIFQQNRSFRVRVQGNKGYVISERDLDPKIQG